MIYSSKTLTNGRVQRRIIEVKGGVTVNFEKMLEKELENNAELRKVLDSPEKKAAYIQKMRDSWNETGGYDPKEKLCCQTCMFAEIIEPIGRQPQTRYCKIYGRQDSHGKPDEVYDGLARCEFYEKEKQK